MDDRAAMDEALRLAEAGGALGNVPVGCVVIAAGRVVGRAYNLTHTLQDPTAHAEVLALREASQALGSWRLEDVTIVVTLEPCAMCAGAVRTARVGRLVYGAKEPRTGAVESTARLLDGAAIEVVPEVSAEPARELLTRFFAARRAEGSGGPADVRGEMAELVEGA